jgi:cytidyltransferase-like protein
LVSELGNQLTRKILGKIYIESLKVGRFGNSLDSLTRSNNALNLLNLPKQRLDDSLRELSAEGLIVPKNPEATSYALTKEGREKIIVVMTGGTFDIIHPGHLDTLSQAKSLGDILAVSVARNSTFRKNKKREPLHDEQLRMELAASIKYVDVAVLGSEENIFETLLFLQPDIVALGYDQVHNEGAIQEGAKHMGVNVKVVRLESRSPQLKSSTIMNSDKNQELLGRI